jgi:predicted AlkP superfamily pyrophosphatase or phosphodiesterase
MILPSVPKALGSLRHVFDSAYHLALGEPNTLGFKGASKIVVVLVDGLGAEQIAARSGHAPWLSKHIAAGQVSHCGFPSTTSVNIGSFATGLTPGEHGLIGHMVQDSNFGHRLNLLTGWHDGTDPHLWQPNSTISEKAFERGLSCNVIAAKEYQETGYTQATMRKANFIAADLLAEKFERAHSVLKEKQNSITYLYIPELDKYAHRHGWQSIGWAALLEEVDGELSSFTKNLPKDAGVIVTADHGMIDTADELRFYLDDYLDLELVDWVGGDTRSRYIYLKNEQHVNQVMADLSVLHKIATPIRTSDAIAAGWFGDVGELARARLPEVMLLAKSAFTLYHTEFSKKRSFEMIGHHGGLSSAELRIPLIRFGL